MAHSAHDYGAVHYGAVRSIEELGRVVRRHRKERGLTLETVSGLANVSTKFLSEFERGKETAEVGKVLKTMQTLGLEMHVQPRKARPVRPPASDDYPRES